MLFLTITYTYSGASGNLGSELVRRALSAGHEITAVVRDRTKLTAMFPNVEMNIITADTSTISHQNMNTFKGIFTGTKVLLCLLSYGYSIMYLRR